MDKPKRTKKEIIGSLKKAQESLPKKPLTIDQMIEGMDNEITLVFEHAKNDSKRIFNTLLDALKGAAAQISRYGAENEKFRKICKDRGIKFEQLLEKMEDQPKPGNRKQRRAAEKIEKKRRKK